MADFKFNFLFPTEDESRLDSVNENHEQVVKLMKEAKEIKPPKELSRFEELHIKKFHFNTTTKHEIELYCLEPEYVEEDIKQAKSTAIVTALEKDTDLIPLVYEGGLKVWECSIDLVEFILQSDVSFSGKKCLELGCGAGLPGLLALIKGANVDFQDYNQEVIEYMTIPNALVNYQKIKENSSGVELSQRCKFFSGEWGKVSDLISSAYISDVKYDIILTSETIYNIDNNQQLYEFIKRHIRRGTGVAYIAAKTYYFGVGGGTRAFEDIVNGDGVFDISVCKKIAEGVQREILIMRFKHM